MWGVGAVEVLAGTRVLARHSGRAAALRTARVALAAAPRGVQATLRTTVTDLDGNARTETRTLPLTR